MSATSKALAGLRNSASTRRTTTMTAAVAQSPDLARLSLDTPTAMSTPETEQDSFVDADTSMATVADDEDDASLKPPHLEATETSPRSSSASDATHSGASAETSPTAHSFQLNGEKKRTSVSSTSTIDEVPLDEVSLDDQPVPSSPVHRSPVSSRQPDTPTQTYVPVASTSAASSPSTNRFTNHRSSLPLSPVSLSASSFVDDPVDATSVDGTVGTSHLAKRRTIGSVASTASGGNNVDFLLQVTGLAASC